MGRPLHFLCRQATSVGRRRRRCWTGSIPTGSCTADGYFQSARWCDDFGDDTSMVCQKIDPNGIRSMDDRSQPLSHADLNHPTDIWKDRRSIPLGSVTVVGTSSLCPLARHPLEDTARTQYGSQRDPNRSETLTASFSWNFLVLFL